MNEYVIHAKLKNNLLLSKILESHKNVASFCEQTGLCPGKVGQLINMKTPAVYASGSTRYEAGDWTKAALDVADALCVHPSELFTEEQKTAELKTNEAFVEISRQQALSMSDPMQMLEAKDLADKLMGAASLTPRQRLTLQMRFGIGCDAMTLDEVGSALDVTRERVRQIESKALRKLRNPDLLEKFVPNKSAAQKAAPIFDEHALKGTHGT